MRAAKSARGLSNPPLGCFFIIIISFLSENWGTRGRVYVQRLRVLLEQVAIFGIAAATLNTFLRWAPPADEIFVFSFQQKNSLR
jgi:hypothetical protein